MESRCGVKEIVTGLLASTIAPAQSSAYGVGAAHLIGPEAVCGFAKQGTHSAGTPCPAGSRLRVDDQPCRVDQPFPQQGSQSQDDGGGMNPDWRSGVRP